MCTEIVNWFKSLQDNICQSLEITDEKGKFQEDLWKRNAGGGGRTRILKDGNIIEKGGVNFSAVYGKTPKNILRALKLPKSNFYATGTSVVIHPKNPMVPIIHMNVRYFEISNGLWWFGGGIDLTPHYVDKKDATFFHHSLKKVCDKHDPSYYVKFKKWADDYFYIAHRKETRGIGGVFFDRLTGSKTQSKEQLFDFVKEIGNTFAPIYTTLMKKNHVLHFSENELAWQRLRRGRYVEFNLILDKGTKFGLDTNGRVESILMSLPPQANWEYNYQMQPDSAEQATTNLLKKNIDWV